MGIILEKLMEKYWKNVKNTGKVYEKILEKCKKNGKSQGNSSVQKSGNHGSWGGWCVCEGWWGGGVGLGEFVVAGGGWYFGFV